MTEDKYGRNYMVKSIQQKYNDLVNDYNLLLGELSREDGFLRHNLKRRFITFDANEANLLADYEGLK